MRASTVKIFLFFIVIPSIHSKLRFVLDEELIDCKEDSWIVDMSQFKLIMINDTTTVANGTCILLKDLNPPWKLNFYGEMFDRGKWQKKFERSFDDFCKHILKPGEIWYSAFKKKLKDKECPYKKDQVFPADEDAVYFDVSFMPPYFEGRWRFTMDGDLGCFRVHFDFVDD